MKATLRKGWCPGALRPMQTGDGLLVRIRPTGGALGLREAATIAECAARYGNGHLDLTSRANLQIRGVTDALLPLLLKRLEAIGLVDRDAGAEGIRNIMASPLAGLDPEAKADIRPALAAVERRLVEDPSLHGLPAKFNIVIDDGGRFGLAEVAADLRFTATASERYRLAIAGAADAGLPCAGDDLPDVVAGLARAFLRLRHPEERLRDTVARLGAAALAAAAKIADAALPRDGGTPAPAPTPAVGAADLLGVRRLGTQAFVGVAAAFGGLPSSDLAAFVAAAGSAGAVELRLTPWRTILATGLTQQAARELAVELEPTGLILDPADPRLRVAACPGAPACGNAGADVRKTAEALAPILAATGPVTAGITLHVSGCRKGCARAAPAPITLVAEAGRYMLVRDGTASSAPEMADLTQAAAADVLRELMTQGETVA